MRTTNRRENHNGSTSVGWEDKAWVDSELDGAYFLDVRLGKRLRTLLGLMSNGIGQTIPLACQDWANTKAAYRFFPGRGQTGKTHRQVDSEGSG
jgi:hypothetical protein